MNTVQIYNWLPVRMDQEGNYMKIEADKKRIFENMSDEKKQSDTESKITDIFKHLRVLDSTIWKIENGVYREDK